MIPYAIDMQTFFDTCSVQLCERFGTCETIYIDFLRNPTFYVFPMGRKEQFEAFAEWCQRADRARLADVYSRVCLHGEHIADVLPRLFL